MENGRLSKVVDDSAVVTVVDVVLNSRDLRGGAGTPEERQGPQRRAALRSSQLYSAFLGALSPECCGR